MFLLILFLVSSIFFSFLCSILEAVLLSITPKFLNQNLAEKASFAPTLKKLKDDIDQPLIAILTLNTIAHTVGAIGVGAQAENVFDASQTVLGVPMIAVVSSVMTLLILVASEIIPKTIGANYWRSLAGFSTRTLDVMVKILKYTGIMFVLQLLTKLIGAEEGHGKSVFSKTEFVALAAEGEKTGHLNKAETKIINRLMSYDKIQVKDVMTPRTVVISADETTTVLKFYETHPNLRFSRIPIYSGDIDNVTGYVMKDDILNEIILHQRTSIDGLLDNQISFDHNQSVPEEFKKKFPLNNIDNNKIGRRLTDIKREITTVDDEVPIPDMFEQFMNKREHIAQVTKNEFGGFEGIVTQEDVIETLLGLEIMDETDGIDDMRKLARKKRQQRAKSRGLEVEDDAE